MVKLADLGDALTATPALRALRRSWPSAAIDVLTSPMGAQALAGLDSLDELVVMDKHQFDRPAGLLSAGQLARMGPRLLQLRRRRYDCLLLVHHLTTAFGTLKYFLLTKAIAAGVTAGLDNGRGWFLDERVPDDGFGTLHEADYAAAVAASVGAKPAPRQLEIAVDGEAAARAEELLPGTDWLALHVGGGTFSLARRWDPAKFAEAANAVAERHGFRAVLIGTAVDREASDQAAAELSAPPLDLVGRLSVKEAAAALGRCRLLLSNDSGVVFLACAVNTPTVAVFGPSNDLAWSPYPPERHRAVRATLPCSPCFYRGKGLGTPQGCPTRDCLALVTPEMVAAAGEELLA
ncbi:MAG: glycosyltransferase family 9 protein [Chloroflexota bacterium]|nr:glycosyltransferase family 9 protein [Chloroflexota bacterium]